MTERPYTDDDLRDQAAGLIQCISSPPTLDDVKQWLTDAWIPSIRTEDSGPEATWGGILDAGEVRTAADHINSLIEGAADTSTWGVHLGADNLVPSTEHQLTLDGDDKPFARILFAFEPDMSDEMKNSLVTSLAQAIAEAL
ncbi:MULTISPECIES: hypothetical protein [unclassified Streptomyces]|uniref:hypothetical protein n=1 Tax=unclassified Streptomyces TaxID=2593676 RepID=UPI002E17ACB0|nr:MULTISPECIES: hypothetical protein [unclassified Streptomyces]